MSKVLYSAAAVAMLALAGGCGHKATKAALKPEAFQPSAANSQAAVSTHAGRSAEAAAPAPSPVSSTPAQAATSAQPAGSPGAAPPSVAAVQTPAAQPAGVAPAAAPAAASPAAAVPTTRTAQGVSVGSYMIVGVVIAEANGQPIYADKVLQKLNDDLAAKATEFAPREFRLYAEQMIRRQVQADIEEEVAFAAAERNTSEQQKQVASALTTKWRQNEISKAGGSLAVTRRRWLDGPERIDFDDKVMEQYRRYLVRLYFEMQVEPLVQLSADDMRQYYDRNREQLFTEKSAVRFRVIRAGSAESGGRDRALTKIQGIHERAKRGEDFGTLALQNDNRVWGKNKGYMELVDETVDGQTRQVPRWWEKGTIALEKVEAAAFALNEKEVSDIIEERDGFYIVKLEEKKSGRARAFEEEEVQRAIRGRLEPEQRARLRQKEYKKLLDASVWRVDEQMLAAAVQMAMQKYTMWK